MTGFLDTSPPGLVAAEDADGAPLLDVRRPTPLEWARRRRNDREARRAELARERAMGRLARLGSAWKVLDITEIGIAAANTFLAIGPGGVFLVTVKQHGRTRVRLAGDIVQIDGRRLPYVSEARKLAERAGKAISKTAGSSVPVTPIVALAGSGVIDVHGLPKGCVVTSYRELDYLLGAYGERISPTTVSKLYSVARHPVTWVGGVHRPNQAQVDAYTWYAAETATDKKSS